MVGARGVATAAATARAGICFDIDGVLLRGKNVLAGAADAVRAVRAAGMPHLFMTNGGGHLEHVRAQQLSAKLGLPVHEEQVVLAHSPMRELATGAHGHAPLADKRVMILGCRDEVGVAKAYGFRKTVTPQEFWGQHPELYRFREPAPGLGGGDPFADEAVEAIMIMHDPVDWHLESQICIDVLLGHDPVAAAGASAQAVPVFNSNEDFVYASSYEHPRFAQGAFLQTLSHLYGLSSGGGTLEVSRFGKPHRVTFEFARERLERQLGPAGGALERIFMVGDNPHADIKGANDAGPPWHSVLLETGVFRRGRDADAGAHTLCADVSEAVQFALRF
mmetsp:Transcript_11379/g.32330  ORF Transcript_11379/g.32330 Transcript_11379/m.32330 type:complete len:334 (+) Transcript_11379:121-1122(+)|eukprot:CAMPEP_0202055956 /NCGR_PEP_ID=MMETSP0963-20130614/21441_1 /ASSEMBLY_ACC=CAM_ASM_000494 /TAXON_ID=4773 /ORGANISM="Schizochytrium aggregatum, Strain ATCC28209" /LENGTH=333 /DNA_ID=CAMNT_0048621619 /DNA_START=49 /DNA_END=1050 /DNA_ORIENTATION=+